MITAKTKKIIFYFILIGVAVTLAILLFGCGTPETSLYNGYEISNKYGQVCIHKTIDTTSSFRCFNTLNEAINFIDKSEGK
jgi:hypothetical protein